MPAVLADIYGAVLQGGPVPAIVRETERSGGLHPYTTVELNGLAYRVSRKVWPYSPNVERSCEQLTFTPPFRVDCTLVKHGGKVVVVSTKSVFKNRAIPLYVDQASGYYRMNVRVTAASQVANIPAV